METETINDIVAELRAMVRELLDTMYDMGIDEETVGIAIESPDCHMNAHGVAQVIKKAKDALAKPPRNCDIGTAEEQHERFMHFCTHVNKSVCNNCPLIGTTSLCQLQWAQMPYEAKESEVKK